MGAPSSLLETHSLLCMRSPSSTASLLGPPHHVRMRLRSSVLLMRVSSTMTVCESDASNGASSSAAIMHMRSAPLPMPLTTSLNPSLTPACEVSSAGNIAEYAQFIICALHPPHIAGCGKSWQHACAATPRAWSPKTADFVELRSSASCCPLSSPWNATKKRAWSTLGLFRR